MRKRSANDRKIFLKHTRYRAHTNEERHNHEHNNPEHDNDFQEIVNFVFTQISTY